MTVWRQPEAPFICIRPIPVNCALRNSASGLRVRVISRHTYIHLNDFFRMLLYCLLYCFNIINSTLQILLYDPFTIMKTWCCAARLKCSPESFNSEGLRFSMTNLTSLGFLDQAPVVQTLDSAIHCINHYPLDNSIGFASVHPLDSYLSGGQHYPSFKQLGPAHLVNVESVQLGNICRSLMDNFPETEHLNN